MFAPGSIGNVGPGLDILGLAVTGAGDAVTVERIPGRKLVIRDPGHPSLPTSPARHAAAIAARAVLTRAGRRGRIGLALWVNKGLPLSGGQGGSAASAVAGACAANALLGEPLDQHELLLAALEAESVVAGRHLDNVAPSLLGGLVLIRSLSPLDVVRLPVPRRLRVVLAHPNQRMETRQGRSVLPREIRRADALHQAAQVAAIVAAVCSGDLELLGRAIDDRIAEPARARLLPGFREAKGAALAAGAVGCSISGSGPTAFALVGDRPTAKLVGQAMREAYARYDLECAIRIAKPDLEGARVV